MVAGTILVIRERLFGTAYNTAGNYYDWSFLLTIALVTASGFATELLHYFRLEPHRHIVYFGHLVFVFALLVYMPYSKFAHIVYRTTALVLAERYGRKKAVPPIADQAPAPDPEPTSETESEPDPETISVSTGGGEEA